MRATVIGAGVRIYFRGGAHFIRPRTTRGAKPAARMSCLECESAEGMAALGGQAGSLQLENQFNFF